MITLLLPSPLTTMPPPKRKILCLSLSFGCRNKKSVSVAELPHHSLKSDLDLSSTTIASSWWEDRDRDSSLSEEASITFSDLLRQLDELEKTVLSLKASQASPEGKDAVTKKKGHTRCKSEGGSVIGESVAIVKDSDDPLSDFRRSMLQMIVEKEIVEVEELKELVTRFLALNSPEHHGAILIAFAEIWKQVFSRYQRTPEFILNGRK